jgi:two-component system OmpR family sensor kinase
MNEALTRVQESYAEQAEFASDVAHELRNPLATIACRIDEIADPVLRARMSASVAHAAHVVDQLMMLAKLGGKAPVLNSIDLRSTILEALAQSAARIIADGRTLEFNDRARGLDLPVEGNEGLTRMSVQNLLDNAHRHTPPGTHICVTLDPRLRVFVEDNGPGIRQTDLERAQLRHWRGTDGVADGAGLGLSIVSKAMMAQNGSLQICESDKGAKIALIFCPSIDLTPPRDT